MREVNAAIEKCGGNMIRWRRTSSFHVGTIGTCATRKAANATICPLDSVRGGRVILGFAGTSANGSGCWRHAQAVKPPSVTGLTGIRGTTVAGGVTEMVDGSGQLGTVTSSNIEGP